MRQKKGFPALILYLSILFIAILPKSISAQSNDSTRVKCFQEWQLRRLNEKLERCSSLELRLEEAKTEAERQARVNLSLASELSKEKEVNIKTNEELKEERELRKKLQAKAIKRPIAAFIVGAVAGAIIYKVSQK